MSTRSGDGQETGPALHGREDWGMLDVDLSIVVPAYNEAQRIGRLLTDIAGFRRNFPGRLEVIVVDDGSQDDTAAVARSHAERLALADAFTVLSLPANRGKGHAVRQGMLKSRGRLVLFCDADGATPMKEFYRLKERIDAGCDVAVGSRDLPGANLVVPQPLHRRLMGAAMRWIVSRLVLDGVRDTQCGFKLFTAAASRSIFSRQTIDGFSFDVEVLYLAQRLGLEVAEVPLEWHDQPGSKVDPWRTPPAMLRDLLAIRLRHRELARAHRTRSATVRW